ncbi:MAG: alpha-2-macroglobulin family protein, partial [Candidatus Eremiobacteraeota bacterium]|nr:alpha-2-macroglobulin family protein [Candidatus Eremiobacteraeota bacterium]
MRWNAENPSQVKVTLDKASYKPGELATALVQSPYPQADLYFSVVREKTLYASRTLVRGGAPRITFRVTPEMLPNAAAQVVLVRRGKPLEKLAAGSLDSLVRIGFASFSTNVDAKYLKLAIVPGRARVSPGDSQTVSFALKHADGTLARGELAVMVVNDAILQLSGYRLPDLVKTVYADQPISTRLSDSRPSVVLSPLTSPLGKGFGYGGGFMEGSGSTRIRRNFQQLAYYGAVQTDGAGKVSVSFKMPDDLTTWRVMAVALGDGNDFRFAAGDGTFISSKPLIANPLLPQFARSGDTLDGGVAVTNTAGTNGTLSLDATLGGALFFATQHSQTLQQQEQLDQATQAFRFPMHVGNGSSGTMQFKAVFGALSDAFSLPLEVRNQAITESVALSGVVPGDQPVSVPFTNSGADGSLELWLASSVVPQVVVPAQRVLKSDPEDFVENAASRLLVASALKEVSARTGQPATVDLASEARKDLAAIAKLRNDDGGLSAWPGAKSDALWSAYAAESLAAAQRAGFVAGAPSTAPTAKYLSGVLSDPGKTAACKTPRCRAFVRLNALIALSDLGDTRSDFLPDIYAQQQELDIADRARLARYLLKFPQWRASGDALAQKLSENIYLTARTAAANVELLSLLVATHASPDVLDNLVRTITVTHCTCPYLDTYATARRLGALVDYLRTQPAQPHFTAEVSGAGQPIEATFNTANAPAKHIRLSSPPRGKVDLQFKKSGNGTLH